MDRIYFLFGHDKFNNVRRYYCIALLNPGQGKIKISL